MVDLFLKGGWVMYPILVCSLLSWAVILERLWHYGRTRVSPARWEELAAGEPPASHLGERRFADLRTSLRLNPAGSADEKERRAKLAATAHLGADSRGLAVLSGVAALGPLLGLFGTVVGMIQLFQGIADSGARPDLATLVGGIWTALLTTGFGLVAALPALVAHQVLDYAAERRAERLEEYHQRRALE